MTDTITAEAATETTDAVAGTTEAAPASAESTLLTGEEGDGNQETETATDDQKAEDKPADGSKDGAEVPETYEFKFEDGLEVDPDTLTGLSETAKELGLTQEQAQKIADLGAKQSERWAGAQQTAMDNAEKQWVADVKADEEIGGDKLNENLAVAKQALDKFGTPELTSFLKESRLGNHPELIRLMNRVGKAIAEDSVVPGGRSTNVQSKPFYANSDHKE
jgi:hypothetical protein